MRNESFNVTFEGLLALEKSHWERIVGQVWECDGHEEVFKNVYLAIPDEITSACATAARAAQRQNIEDTVIFLMTQFVLGRKSKEPARARAALHVAQQCDAATRLLIALVACGYGGWVGVSLVAEAMLDSARSLLSETWIVSALRPYLGHANPEVRLAAFRALRRATYHLGRTSTLMESANQILKDPDPRVRRVAEQIVKWGPPSGVGVLNSELGF
jgi:hypothetical protein